MADLREGPHLSVVAGVRIRAIVDAAGWWVLTKLDEDDGDGWRRQPLAAWALVDDDGGQPFVVGLSADGLDVVELCDHPARYVYESTFPPCSCPRPSVRTIDGFCSRCAGVTQRAA